MRSFSYQGCVTCHCLQSFRDEIHLRLDERIHEGHPDATSALRLGRRRPNAASATRNPRVTRRVARGNRSRSKPENRMFDWTGIRIGAVTERLYGQNNSEWNRAHSTGGGDRRLGRDALHDLHGRRPGVLGASDRGQPRQREHTQECEQEARGMPKQHRTHTVAAVVSRSVPRRVPLD